MLSKENENLEIKQLSQNEFQVLISTSPVKYTSWIDKSVLITSYLESYDLWRHQDLSSLSQVLAKTWQVLSQVFTKTWPDLSSLAQLISKLEF